MDVCTRLGARIPFGRGMSWLVSVCMILTFAIILRLIVVFAVERSTKAADTGWRPDLPACQKSETG